MVNLPAIFLQLLLDCGQALGLYVDESLECLHICLGSPRNLLHRHRCFLTCLFRCSPLRFQCSLLRQCLGGLGGLGFGLGVRSGHSLSFLPSLQLIQGILEVLDHERCFRACLLELDVGTKDPVAELIVLDGPVLVRVHGEHELLQAVVSPELWINPVEHSRQLLQINRPVFVCVALSECLNCPSFSYRIQCHSKATGRLTDKSDDIAAFQRCHDIGCIVGPQLTVWSLQYLALQCATLQVEREVHSSFHMLHCDWLLRVGARIKSNSLRLLAIHEVNKKMWNIKTLRHESRTPTALENLRRKA
mmetsp:Transcript_17485/g.48304  ORF Transcript_17485/g.48304 Transcript_17485/m.48304 type:complete len:304 (+) Transcript_17485:374-1285(+)